MISKLSPQAEAVWDAFNEVSERVGVFEDYGDALAAAIRSLVEEVVLPKYQYADWQMAHVICEELHKIACELDGTYQQKHD